MKSKKRIIRIGIAGTLVLGSLVAWYYGHSDLNEWAEMLEGIKKEAAASGILLGEFKTDSKAVPPPNKNVIGAMSDARLAVSSAGGVFKPFQNGGADALRTSLEPYREAIDAWMETSKYEVIARSPSSDGSIVSIAETDVLFAATLLLADARVARADGAFDTWSERLIAVYDLSRHARAIPVGAMQSASVKMRALLGQEISTALVEKGSSAAAANWPAVNLSDEITTGELEHFIKIEAGRGQRIIPSHESGSWIKRIAKSRNSDVKYPFHPHAYEANEAVWLTFHIMALAAVRESQGDWPAVMDSLSEPNLFLADVARNAGSIARRYAADFRINATAWAVQETERRLLLVAADTLQYRLAHGQYPAELRDLGAASIDPYSHKPFGYTSLGAGFHVYSVGADRIDSGGVRKDGLSKASNSDDLGFRMSGPPVESSS